MPDSPYILAEAAQGYEGSADVAKLLVRAAKAGAANGIKFQLVFADDLAEPGYQYYGLFRDLEMPAEQWQSVRDTAAAAGVDFVVDVFGPASLEVAGSVRPDAVKLHSTTFFETGLVRECLRLAPLVYVSVGGIEPAEIEEFVGAHGLAGRTDVVLMFGFQAEPTPTESNHLLRIGALRDLTGLEVGFMDHAHGGAEEAFTLAPMALSLGVRRFEKHITLDRALEMEDSVSALAPAEFARYCASLRRLHTALGSPSLELSDEERGYRQRALKRVVAAGDLSAGRTLTEQDLALRRPAEPGGLYRVEHAVGRRLRRDLCAGAPVGEEDVE